MASRAARYVLELVVAAGLRLLTSERLFHLVARVRRALGEPPRPD